LYLCNILLDDVELEVEGEFDEEEEDDFETDEDLDDVIEEDDDVEVETIDTEEFEVTMVMYLGVLTTLDTMIGLY